MEPLTSPPVFEDIMQMPKDSLNLESSPTGQYEETKSNKMPVKAITVQNFHDPPAIVTMRLSLSVIVATASLPVVIPLFYSTEMFLTLLSRSGTLNRPFGRRVPIQYPSRLRVKSKTLRGILSESHCLAHGSRARTDFLRTSHLELTGVV